MPYEVVFPSERVERAFQKSLGHVPTDYREAIVTVIRSLATNPKPQGKRTKKLAGQLIVLQFTAQYRLRVGPYRVLYDVDDQRKKVVILKNSPSGMSAHTNNGSDGRERHGSLKC